MKTMNFDAVAASAPLNRDASVARDGSGDLWEAALPPHVEHFKAPPPPEAQRPPHSRDITGMVRGRLTAIRYHRPTSSGTSMWLMRCTCGDYELRRANRFVDTKDPDLCCHACLRVRQLRERASRPPSKTQRRKQAAMLDRIAEQARARA